MMCFTYNRLIRLLHAPIGRRAARTSVPFRQLFWLLMLAGHTPALVGAWRSFVVNGLAVERLGGCVLLTLTMVFFALKARDIALLRFRSDRRSWVAIVMVVALLHLDVVRTGDDPTLVPQYTTLIATTWLAVKICLVRRHLRPVLMSATSTPVHLSSLMRSADTAWLDAFRPRCWVLAFRLFLLRAPPT